MITDRALTVEEAEEFAGHFAAGLAELGVVDTSAASEIMERLSEQVDAWPRRETTAEQSFDTDRVDDLAWWLGTVWGRQVARSFGWAEVVVLYRQDEFYAVVSPDRAFALYPINFIAACLKDPEADFTGTLIFNTMHGGSYPPSNPGSYLDLTTMMFRIVPRR